jgi:NAD(P)H-flavin reductase
MTIASPDDPFALAPVRISSKRWETPDTFTIELDAPGFRFEPGQFNMLWLFGGGEVPISISGDPEPGAPLVHTIRAVGGVTSALGALEVGATVGLRGPYGAPWPLAAAAGDDLVVVAGGLGMAPLRPVVCFVRRHRARFGRVTLLVGAREPDAMPFRDELGRLREEAAIDVRLTVDHAPRGWEGAVGVVPALIDAIPIEAGRTRAFVCGPEVMMRFSARALEARGVDRGRIHLSLERSMKCAVGLCGHCQLRELFICRDGPVLPLGRVAPLLAHREL